MHVLKTDLCGLNVNLGLKFLISQILIHLPEFLMTV